MKDAIAAYNAGSAFKTAEGRYVSGSGKIDVQGYVDKVYSNTLTYQNWLKGGGEATIQFAYWDLAVPILIAGVVFLWIWRRNQTAELMET
jgi:hypothetical protein